MPHGYDTAIGQRADAVSGGQRQRLCLPRALAGSPEFLILDEPTSSLDAQSEHLIQRSLDELRGHLTLLVVAHRLTTLSLCDRVMVILGGRLEAFASARSLYDTNAFYRDHDVIDRALQAHGGLGYSTDLPLEAMYRFARAARIYDGPDEVHRASVARQVLRGYEAPADGVPSEFIPARREAARERFAAAARGSDGERLTCAYTSGDGAPRAETRFCSHRRAATAPASTAPCRPSSGRSSCTGAPVYVRKEIVHNKHVVEQLRERGRDLRRV